MIGRAGDDGHPSLRFAFLTELYLPNVGGQEVFFQELGEAMVRLGHQVDVYCIGHELGLAVSETLNGVHIHRYPNSGRYMHPRLPALRRNWSDIVKYSAGVRRCALADRHDFYLLNQWPLLHVAALPGGVRARSGIHWCEVRGGVLFHTLQARLPRMVGSNFAVSSAVAEAITEQSGRPTLVLPSGIQLERYRQAPRGQRSGVLYVGRLAAHKNLELLIDAFDLAAARGFLGDLVIAGDGPVRGEIEAYARQSKSAARIQVVGSVSEDKKIELLSQSVVLGMPSRREGFPRVITEAMASGLPVVTARFPENGAKEVVAQYGAGIVCGIEPGDFADALLRAEAGWESFSQAGIEGAQCLDWSGIARTLEARAIEVAARR